MPQLCDFLCLLRRVELFGARGCGLASRQSAVLYLGLHCLDTNIKRRIGNRRYVATTIEEDYSVMIGSLSKSTIGENKMVKKGTHANTRSRLRPLKKGEKVVYGGAGFHIKKKGK